jgi:hypothetical protein
LVDDIWGAREVLRDDEPDELLEDFLEHEVNYLAEVMETPFFDDEDEAVIYSKLREGACAIELAIFELMKVGFRASYENWRWSFYDQILEFSRELSRVGVGDEEQEIFEDEDAAKILDFAEDTIVTPPTTDEIVVTTPIDAEHSDDRAWIVSPGKHYEESPC